MGGASNQVLISIQPVTTSTTAVAMGLELIRAAAAQTPATDAQTRELSSAPRVKRGEGALSLAALPDLGQWGTPHKQQPLARRVATIAVRAMPAPAAWRGASTRSVPLPETGAGGVERLHQDGIEALEFGGESFEAADEDAANPIWCCLGGCALEGCR
jgi:hypothetical protein